MLLAGDAYNDDTLPRFFILHAAVLPVTMILLLAIHIVLIRLHGVTELQFEDEPPDEAEHFHFFPDHFYTELIIGPGPDDRAERAGDGAAGDAGSAGRSADDARSHQAGVVLLRHVPLAEAVLRHGGRAEHGLHRVRDVRLAVHRRRPFASTRGARRPASGSALSACLLIIGLTVWEAVVEH